MHESYSPGGAGRLRCAPGGTHARRIATEPAPTSRVSPSLATAQMADGTQLRTLRWEPDAEPWAVAEIVHGLGEHGGRYDTVAAALTGAGLDTWAYDHRGNGGSGGPRVYVERWSQLHDDLGERLAALRRLHPGRPLVVYAHSLGGMIALGYVLSPTPRGAPRPAGAQRAGPRRRPARLAAADGPTRRPRRAAPQGREQPAEGRALARPVGRGPRGRRPALQHPLDGALGRRGVRRAGPSPRAAPDARRAARPDLRAPWLGGPLVPVRASAVLEGKGNVTRRVLRRAAPRAPPRAGARGHPGGGGRLDPSTAPRLQRTTRCRLGRQPHIRLRGARDALRVWLEPQTRGT